MTGKSDFDRGPLDLFDQTRLADAGLAAHIHDLATSDLPACRQCCLDEAQFDAATDEWPLFARSRPQAA